MPSIGRIARIQIPGIAGPTIAAVTPSPTPMVKVGAMLETEMPIPSAMPSTRRNCSGADSDM